MPSVSQRRKFASRQPAAREGARLPFVCVAVFMDMLGVGLIVPVLPRLIEQTAGLPVTNAAVIGGYLLMTHATTQFLVGPLVGGLGDAVGRRPVMLLAFVGLSLSYVLMAEAPSLWMLFLARLVSGAFSATFPVANATVADLSSEGERGRNFGLLSAAVAAGLVAGPVLGAIAAQASVRAPFLIASVLCAGVAILGLLTYPESLPVSRRRGLTLARANPLTAIAELRGLPGMGSLLLAFGLVEFAGTAMWSVWAYFVGLKFNWSSGQIGSSTALFGLSLVVFQGLLVGKAIRTWGALSTAVVGAATAAAIYGVLAFADADWMLYACALVGGVTGLAIPALQALATARTAANAQGALQGVLGSLAGLTAAAGPLVMTQVFQAANGGGANFPGAPFLISAAAVVMALLTLLASQAALPNPLASPIREERPDEA